ncbi:hypothetical protein FSW04_09920 [Baekduia soli]|uniref:Uncharacterized protein n=1 Tax=Baekduia soli TaxID=496014 RepID=A0A5B8U443_9ACTN|nr:hypothetical protein [Baekduia soli]QEC47856.1 hypothetical protein FSW04_09920 [Baekduia soli]
MKSRNDRRRAAAREQIAAAHIAAAACVEGMSPFYVPCRNCLADAGTLCLDADGAPLLAFHRERLRATHGLEPIRSAYSSRPPGPERAASLPRR